MKKIIPLVLSIFAFFIGLSFAVYTDHRWEDWYITFRAAKNMAIGNGLVFNNGEYIMTYTSPFGTLIPGFIRYVFLSYSDDLTLWVYRFFSLGLFSFALYLLAKILLREGLRLHLVIFCVSTLTFNILIVDNIINGMETGFMFFFLSYLVVILLEPKNDFCYHLGICFAGLMLSRPDGFIYGGSLILANFIFNSTSSIMPRKIFLKNCFIGLLIALIIYCPWLIFTWIYYDTPIPHTIVAKSSLRNFEEFNFLGYNYKLFTQHYHSITDAFMPPYWRFGGWDYPIHYAEISRLIGLFTSFFWLIPFANSKGRMFSFTAYMCHFYLNTISGQGPMPWYLPNVAIFNLLSIPFIFNSIFDHLGKIRIRWMELIVNSAYGIFVLFSVLIFAFGAIELKLQQNIVEFGNRKKIGLWLNENANQKDRVFLECLGYIGFYSELKTLDYPGMSSPEVVKVVKENKLHPYDFASIIKILKPEWLVLRPTEVASINSDSPDLISTNYKLSKTFDVSSQINSSGLKFGKEYLLGDAIFKVYRRNSP
jgi:hypothetical protein